MTLRSDSIVLEVAADPGSPVDGEIWYNTVDGKFKVYENSAQKDLFGAGGSPNLDGGEPGTNFGGIDPIDGGAP